MRRKYYIFILLAVMAFVTTGCDKWDCNGDLDGMWQLTEWRDKDNVVKATKQDMIFYSFQLQMASFRKKKGEPNYIRSLMKASPEEIIIYDHFEYVGNGHDAVQPMSVLSGFGVPADGIFRVQVLTGSNMVLRTTEEDVLTFRKY